MKLTLSLLSLLFVVGCATTRSTDFRITDKPAGPPFAGFGVCMNPYLYAFPNTPDEISPEKLADLEAKIKTLHPQFVRVFFLNSWWEQDTDKSIAKNHPGMRQSLIRTLKLMQDSGATVLLQLWYDPERYKDPEGVSRRFAQAIADLREKHGLTNIQYATLQNEPNEEDHDITKEQYVRLYRGFDRALRDLGIRDKIKIVGGDLVGENQEHWFEILGRDLSPVLDGFSIHSYWDYWRISTFRYHIAEVLEILNKMPAKERRPIYVTEFGAQGFRDKPGTEPGKSAAGKPVASDPVYSFEIGIFLLDALNTGFAGTAQWDMVDIWYDRKMGYGVIGPVEENFPRKPGYWLLSMFTHTTDPGWRAMKIDGKVENVWVAAMKGPSGGTSVFVLNRVHKDVQVSLSGLPPNRSLNSWIWNDDRKGMLKPGGPVAVDKNGKASVKLHEMAIEVLTTK